MNSVEKIVQQVVNANLEPGAEHLMGEMFPLAKSCGAESEDNVFQWMNELGVALHKAGFALAGGKGNPNELWAIKP